MSPATGRTYSVLSDYGLIRAIRAAPSFALKTNVSWLRVKFKHSTSLHNIAKSKSIFNLTVFNKSVWLGHHQPIELRKLWAESLGPRPLPVAIDSKRSEKLWESLYRQHGVVHSLETVRFQASDEADFLIPSDKASKHPVSRGCPLKHKTGRTCLVLHIVKELTALLKDPASVCMCKDLISEP